MPLALGLRIGKTITLRKDGKVLGTITPMRKVGSTLETAFDFPFEIEILRDDAIVKTAPETRRDAKPTPE